MRKLLALLTAFASPALAQTPAGVINAPVYATGYISQVGGTNVTTTIKSQPNHPTNLNIYTTGAISGTWTIKLPNPAFEGQMLSFNCGAAANAIAIVSSDGSSIDSNLPTSCITNGGFVAQFDLRSNIWRSLGSGYSANFRPFTGVTSQWPWQLNTDGTWSLLQPKLSDLGADATQAVGPLTTNPYSGTFPSYLYGIGGLGYYDTQAMARNFIYGQGSFAVTNPYPYGDLNTTNAGIFGTGSNRPGCVSGYTDPSQVAAYYENGAAALCNNSDSQPVMWGGAGTFTSTTFTPTTPIPQSESVFVAKGMWIRSGDTPPFNGQVTSFTVNGSNAVTSITVSNWYQINYGVGSSSGTPSSSVAYLNPQDKIWAQIGEIFLNAQAITCDITSGSKVLTNCSSTSGLFPNGQWVTNANLPAGSYVVSYTASTITVNANATGSATAASVKVSAGSKMGTGVISEDDIANNGEPVVDRYVTGTGDTTNGSYTISNVTNATSLRPNMLWAQSGVPLGSIAAVDTATNTVTLNVKATSTASGAAYTGFTPFDEGGLGRDCSSFLQMAYSCFLARGATLYSYMSLGASEVQFLARPSIFGSQPKYGFRVDTRFLAPSVAGFALGGASSDVFTVDNGGNVTGQVITANNGAVITGAAETYRSLSIQTSGSNRWQIGATNAAESGGNAGSDFFIFNYSDAGAVVSTPLSIVRATGQTRLSALALPLTGYLKGNGSGVSLTASSTVPLSDVSGLGTGVATALGNALNASGGVVGYGGSAGPLSVTTLSASGAVSIAGTTLTMTNASSFFPQMSFINQANDANSGYVNIVKGRGAAGVGASAAQVGDIMGTFNFQAYDSNGDLQNAGVALSAYVDSVAAGSVTGHMVLFGNITVVSGLALGSPTGSYKGNGTINVQSGYYANGTAGVTCNSGLGGTSRTINGIVTTC